MRPEASEAGQLLPARLEVSLFGHARFTFDGQPHDFGAQRKTLPIFAYVLLHRGATVARDYLAFTMWPDVDEDVARGNLRRNLSLLRHVLPPPDPATSWIVGGNEYVQWNPAAPCRLDVTDFEGFCADPATLPRAIELYRGDLLEDTYDEWVFPERERLRAKYLSALKALIRNYRSDRDFASAIAIGRRLLAGDPLREDVVRELAAAHYELGDRAGALAEIEEFQRRLRMELGIEMMPETQVLRDIILRGERATVAAPYPATSSREGERATDPSAQLPFVGREAPLERAAHAWSQAARGRGSVILVTGEAGIGKTRFASELALIVEQQGGRVLLGAAASPEQYAYQPFVEALRPALPLLFASKIERIWLQALAAVIPELAAGSAPFAAAAPLAAESERTRLFEAFARAFSALATARPLLLILEDLHWAGAASTDLLQFIASRTLNERLAVVATYRGEEVLRAHPLRAVRRELQRRCRAAIIELQRLDEPAVGRVLAHLGARDPPLAGRVTRLYEWSLGHPLFLTELVRDALERPAAPPGSDSQSVPESVSAAIAMRLGRLGEAARHALEVASVAGQSFELELIGEITGWGNTELLDACDELVERHLIRTTTSRERGAYAFTHHLVRSAAYAAIAEPARRSHHGLAARALGSMYPARRDELAADLAQHYTLAGEPAAAARAWLRAANVALASFANEDAAERASRGLALVAEDALLKAALLVARIDAHDRLGKRQAQAADIQVLIATALECADAELHRDALRREVSLQHALGDTVEQAVAIAALLEAIQPSDRKWLATGRLCQAQLAFDRADYEAACAVSAEAAELFHSIEDERGELAAVTLRVSAEAECDHFERSREQLARARQISQRLNDPFAAAQVLRGAFRAPAKRQHFAEARGLARELLELARAIGDRLTEASAHDRLAMATGRMFAVREAFEGFAAALEIYASIGNRSGMRVIENNRAAFEAALGRPEAARERLLRLRTESAADDDVRSLYFAESNFGVAAHIAGDFVEAKAAALRALARAEQIGSGGLAALVLGDLGAAESELGEFEAACRHLEEAVARHRRLDQRMTLTHNLSRLALACARSGDLGRAAELASEVAARYQSAPESFEEPAETLWYAAQAFGACGRGADAVLLIGKAKELLEQRLGAIDVPEYRESYAALRWHRALTARDDPSAESL